MNIEKWIYNYHNKKIINIKNELTNMEIDLLKKLNITLENKIYTEYEYECLKLDIAEYYKDDDMDKEELKYVKPLENGITRIDYNNLLKTFEKIDQKYEDKFNKISA